MRPGGSGQRCLFLDATALAKVVADEDQSERVRALHAPAQHALATTRLAPLEVARSILQRARAGDLGTDVARRSAANLLGLVEARYLIQEITPPVARATIELVAAHGLTLTAAMTLASLKELTHARRDLRVALVSFDAALTSAARAERVLIENLDK